MSYLVMECHMGYAVVLDEYGRFLKVVNRHYEVGQTVYDIIPVRERTQPTVYIRAARIAVAVAACLLLVIGVSWWNWWMPYGSIYMKINPEVQMELNRYGDVLRVEGVNEDGKTLLEGYEYKGKDKTQIAKELIERAISLQMLSSGGEVRFDVDSSDQSFSDDTKAILTHAVQFDIEDASDLVFFVGGNKVWSFASEEQPETSSPEESSKIEESSKMEESSLTESSHSDDDDSDDDDSDDDDSDDDDDDDSDDDDDDDDDSDDDDQDDDDDEKH